VCLHDRPDLLCAARRRGHNQDQCSFTDGINEPKGCMRGRLRRQCAAQRCSHKEPDNEEQQHIPQALQRCRNRHHPPCRRQGNEETCQGTDKGTDHTSAVGGGSRPAFVSQRSKPPQGVLRLDVGGNIRHPCELVGNVLLPSSGVESIFGNAKRHQPGDGADDILPAGKRRTDDDALRGT
jgi:hypothetical protein